MQRLGASTSACLSQWSREISKGDCAAESNELGPSAAKSEKPLMQILIAVDMYVSMPT